MDPSIIRDRITLHTGDLGDALCGFSQETIAELRGRVPLIINVAGLVEFTPPVDESFRSNVDGAENVIALARALGAKLVHVSTCFVCGKSDGLVEEDEPIPGFYPNRKSLSDDSFRARDEAALMRERIREVYEVSRAAAAKGRDVEKETRQKLSDLGVQRAAQWGWVNTYTYSKSIGEQLIATEPGLEYSIVRPAIVEAALEFPFPGWVEGGRTAAPLIMMAMSGLRHWPLRADAPMEVVPVDQVATAILTAGALLIEGKARHVYHLGTADRNPVPLGDIVEWMFDDYCKLKHRPRLLMPGVRLLVARTGQAPGPETAGPAAHDAGGCVGFALFRHARQSPRPRAARQSRDGAAHAGSASDDPRTGTRALSPVHSRQPVYLRVREHPRRLRALAGRGSRRNSRGRRRKSTGSTIGPSTK